ncbi:Chitin synthase, class 5 [Blastocladiella emersonii ATCC 22665]|nr:Chitin synthase, class 5 [Blastocladiella emersonii ATCC 22665]
MSIAADNHAHAHAAAQSAAIQLVVGKIDAGVAILLTGDHHILEFPTLLLPPDIATGSIIDVSVSRNVHAEAEALREFAVLQDTLLAELGDAEPVAPTLAVARATRDSATLHWAHGLATGPEPSELQVVVNNNVVTSHPVGPGPVDGEWDVHGLEPGYAYTCQLVLRGPAGPPITSEPVIVRTLGERVVSPPSARKASVTVATPPQHPAAIDAPRTATFSNDTLAPSIAEGKPAPASAPVPEPAVVAAAAPSPASAALVEPSASPFALDDVAPEPDHSRDLDAVPAPAPAHQEPVPEPAPAAVPASSSLLDLDADGGDLGDLASIDLLGTSTPAPAGPVVSEPATAAPEPVVTEDVIAAKEEAEKEMAKPDDAPTAAPTADRVEEADKGLAAVADLLRLNVNAPVFVPRGAPAPAPAAPAPSAAVEEEHSDEAATAHAASHPLPDSPQRGTATAAGDLLGLHEVDLS